MSTTPVRPLSTPTVSLPSSTPSASSTSSNESAAQASLDALGDPNTFLTLLVAQLQYQDPESPADGTAFVTQLATFAGVEQQAQMRSDLDSINSIAEAYAASQTATAPTTTTPPTASMESTPTSPTASTTSTRST
jgi:flagellar basal-body rod modification protein FlgD